MHNRREEIKRRIARRKKQRDFERGTRPFKQEPEIPVTMYDDSPDFWVPPVKRPSSQLHPLFNKDTFLLKMLISAILVLIVAILFQTPSGKLEPAREAIIKVMEEEFQFASVSKWYEELFGMPLTLFPFGTDGKQKNQGRAYALPASAKILEDFNSETGGVLIQTDPKEEVIALQEGVVLFAGTKEPYGKIVILQHPDNTETWYGQLGEIYVSNYDQVKTGEVIGQVSNKGNSGEFYFAIKEGETFIDPIQVIKFE